MIFENTLEDELCSMIPSCDYQYSISLTSCQDVVCIELYTYGLWFRSNFGTPIDSALVTLQLVTNFKGRIETQNFPRTKLKLGLFFEDQNNR